MVNELDRLESKIAQAVLLCSVLRAENAQLREQLAAAQEHERNLTERINTARERIEKLVHQLPESESGE